MTVSPLLARRRRLTREVKREVRRLWATREYDTMDLANFLGVSEADIYSTISTTIVTSPTLPIPIPPYAGYDPTERW